MLPGLLSSVHAPNKRLWSGLVPQALDPTAYAGLCRDYIGMMENKMESAIEGLGFRALGPTAYAD